MRWCSLVSCVSHPLSGFREVLLFFFFFFTGDFCAGLGAVQRQVSGGDRQAGPADLEDSPPLRPQQEQRL